MKELSEYIFEALTTNNDEEVKKLSGELLDILKKQGNLKKFVTTMNKLLEKCSREDNAAVWYAAIKDLFDGEYGDGQKYDAKYENISVKDLYPTQSEIDIENSAKWLSTKFINMGTVDAIFTKKDYGSNFGCPVLVYDDGKKWIIDGHHRWSQVGLLNPNGSLYCLVVSGPAKVQDFLKLTQGAIAAVIADESNPNHGEGGKLPVGKARPENNIFGSALKGDKLKKRILDMMSMEGTGDILPELVNKYVDDVNDEDSLAEFIMDNRDKLVANGQKPESWAAPRPVMPQTDTASPRGFKAAGAEEEGGALYAISKKGSLPKLK